MNGKGIGEEPVNVEVTSDREQSVKRFCVPPGEVVIGVLTDINDSGQPVVKFSIPNFNSESLIAVSTISIAKNQIGRQVALLFLEGEITRPVVMGIIHSPLHALLDSYRENASLQSPVDEKSGQRGVENVSGTEIAGRTDSDQKVFVDGKRVEIEGREQVVLKCGESSITLTRAGKVMIRGKYILNRSSGVNRILGGSVQVN